MLPEPVDQPALEQDLRGPTDAVNAEALLEEQSAQDLEVSDPQVAD